ncbi:HpcH/HpaI aldolase/citrate lyase family protein [Streptomyces endophyticus]|uniref:CoA ester lyase n=1 Tax=Streptomyces endophyticus TaxID=714166 RepID=A0ABU6EWY0_9ACTN|nr:CoA ester lyase [Streptomyces endophyticus]MEB8336187.1 CoA ester lyase [Streptomyces endophyticus]
MSSEVSSELSSASSAHVHRPPLRSLLFVPGNKTTDWLPKAHAAGADAVVLDLEDAVPEADRAAAVRQVTEALAGRATDASGPALFVRVRPLDGWTAAEELRTVCGAGLSGIVLPKVSGPDDVRLADRILAWSEAEHGLPRSQLALVPLLETAAALRGAYGCATAATGRVAYLGAITGAGGDVERAVGYRWSPDGHETHALRARVLLDVRAAGAPHPVAGLWTRIGDLDGLRAFAEQNRALGYTGMMAIHPSHVPVINEVFAPTSGELARAARLIAAMEEAQAHGVGAVTFEGEMVDEAMAATARALLVRHA